MKSNLNLQGKRIFIKNYENLIYYVKIDNNKYLSLSQMNCSKNARIVNIKLLDNTNNILIYKHFNETHTNKFKLLKLYKKIYLNIITIINNLYDVYIVSRQINDNIFYDKLYYDNENSLSNTNEKRLSYKVFLKNTIESILLHISSNDKRIVLLRNIYYKLHLKCLKGWEIDIMKDDNETYNKYLTLVEKYENNTQPFKHFKCSL